jgi:predicted nucleic acid-binding protein
LSSYVLDASVTAAWLLPNQKTAQSEAMFEHAFEHRFHAPRFFLYEVRQIVLKAERARVFAPAEADSWMDDLWSLPIAIDSEPTETRLADVHALARQAQLSFYDALYLELALRADLPIASGDRALLNAAVRRGLEVYDVRSTP